MKLLIIKYPILKIIPLLVTHTRSRLRNSLSHEFSRAPDMTAYGRDVRDGVVTDRGVFVTSCYRLRRKT